MEFDDRLHRAFHALTERLHHEIATQLDAVRADLSESVRADREAAVGEAIRETRVAAERETNERLAAHVTQAGTNARAEATAAQAAATERLTDAVRAIDGAHSLSDTLDVLVTAAAAEAGRAAVFLPHGSTLKGWRLVGFDGAASSTTELPLTEGGIITEASETASMIRIDPASPRGSLLPQFVELPEQSRAVAVPLVMTGQVFSVLYADEGQGQPRGGESWPASIELLARHAARTLEAMTASRLAQVAELVSR